MLDTTTSWKWRLYMKDGKRFHPVDWRAGTTVRNLIHATMFSDEEKLKVQTQLDLPQNAHLEFEWRTV